MKVYMHRYNMLFLILFGLVLHHGDGRAMNPLAALQQINENTVALIACGTVAVVGVGTVFFLSSKIKDLSKERDEIMDKIMQLSDKQENLLDRASNEIKLQSKLIEDLTSENETLRTQNIAQCSRHQKILEAGEKAKEEWLKIENPHYGSILHHLLLEIPNKDWTANEKIKYIFTILKANRAINPVQNSNKIALSPLQH